MAVVAHWYAQGAEQDPAKPNDPLGIPFSLGPFATLVDATNAANTRVAANEAAGRWTRYTIAPWFHSSAPPAPI